MIVVKFGGHAMTDEHGGFAAAIASALSKGVQIVIVHGGGPHDFCLLVHRWDNIGYQIQ
jgi:acetylglutamate kinase